MRKYLLACCALIASAPLLAGCGGSGKGTSDGAPRASSQSYAELRWGFPAFPGPIDFDKNGWDACAAIQHLVVQNLVEFTSSGGTKPGLASAIEKPSSTTYVFKLRPGVRFSDGHPLTAADVVYSLQQDATGKESEWAPSWTDMSSVAARGNAAVVMKLKRPSATWLQIMAFSSQVIEKEAATKAGEAALGTPADPLIGTGPWKIDSFKPEASVQLSRNAYWAGPKQPAERISITIFKEESSTGLALRSGAIDGTFVVFAPKIFAGIPGSRSLTAPGTGAVVFGMNTQAPPFDNVHVRRAIAYAIDVPALGAALYPKQWSALATLAPTDLFAGLGSTSQVNAALASIPQYSFNLAAARRELARSPYPHGFTTELQALAAERANVLLMEALGPNLAKIGIKTKVRVIQNDEVAGWIGKKVTMIATERWSTYNDPEGIFSTLLPPSDISPPGSGTNFARYKNAEVDALSAKQSEALEPARRLQLLSKLLGIVAAEAGYIGLLTHPFYGTLSEKYVFSGFGQLTAMYTPWALNVKLAK